MTESDRPGPEHLRPGHVDDDTIAAVGKLSEALECVERARGHLYDMHQLIGHADRLLGEAADKEFARLSAGLENNPALFLATPFPIPDPEDFQVAPKTLHRKVILSGVRYPERPQPALSTHALRRD